MDYLIYVIVAWLIFRTVWRAKQRQKGTDSQARPSTSTPFEQSRRAAVEEQRQRAEAYWGQLMQKKENLGSAERRWYCEQCGEENDGLFCKECGAEKPPSSSTAKETVFTAGQATARVFSTVPDIVAVPPQVEPETNPADVSLSQPAPPTPPIMVSRRKSQGTMVLPGFNQQSLVNGIIMAEILGPCKVKRPLRHGARY